MLSLMAKKQKPTRGRGRPATGKDTVPLQMRIERSLRDMLDQAATLGDRPRNREIIIALREHLKRVGVLKDDQSPPSD